MIVRQLFLFVILIVAFSPGVFSSSFSSPSPLSVGDSSGNCVRSCAAGDRNGQSFSYPFGFSPGCEIQLNCSDIGEVKIDEFRVQNVTADSILIDLPVNCSRPIGKLDQLLGTNYRITSRNGLLLQHCRTPINGCSIPIDIFNSRLGNDSCDSGRDSNTVGCYSEANSNVSFLDLDRLKNTSCSTLFSSIAIDLNNEISDNSSRTTALSLEFRTLELGWWLGENSTCDENAKRINVSLADGGMGYRCQCLEGYVGDGFKAGNRCRKDESNQDDEQWFKSPWFYGSVVLGYAFGFWGLCAPLVVYAPFRQAYFRVLNRGKDSLLLAIALKRTKLKRWLQS